MEVKIGAFALLLMLTTAGIYQRRGLRSQIQSIARELSFADD